MGYLNDTLPADTEGVTNGANRIRELKTQLNVLLAQIWTDTGGFLTKWITQAMLGDAIVGAGQLAPGAVGAAAVADGSLTAAKLADDSPGGLLGFDGSGNATVFPIGTNGQILASNGTVPSFEDVPPPIHGVVTLIAPAVVVNLSNSAAVPWVTVAHLESYGVPVTATLLLLQVQSQTTGSPGVVIVQARPIVGGNAYDLFASSPAGGSSFIGGGGPTFAPLVSSGGNVSFDYQTTGALVSLVIKVVGYVS